MDVQKRLHTSPVFAAGLVSLLFEYRLKLKITEKIRLSDGEYYVCPRCRVSLERDYQNFCDRCGQHLDWTGCKKAKVIYPGSRNS